MRGNGANDEVVSRPVVDNGTRAGTSPQWQPEHVVDVVAAAALVGAQFPELRDAPIEALATGWDNTVYLVGGDWVFRFPRRTIAVPGVQREIAVLPGLAPRLPLSVPVPELIGRPARDYPWPFWGARLVHGRELAETGLPDAERTPAAAGVGEFLRALHRPELATELRAALPYDPMRRGDPGVRAPKARERLAGLAARGVWEPDPAIERLLADGERVGPPTGDPVVSHGDLHVRHLLLDDEARPAGVIDWGDLCLAGRAVDLSLAYMGFAGAARAALLSSYGPISPEDVARGRVLAVDLCATLAEYAAATGRRQLLTEAVSGLRRVPGS
jgi:aminoglycoside phosphotransferase (APT) family kinase protein